MRRESKALVLRTLDFGNTSQIVSLLTRERGLVDGLAKGAHRPRNAFQGPFDIGVVCRVGYLPRSSGLAVITDAEVLDGLRGLRRSWQRHVLASELIEILRAVAVPEDPVAGLFDLAIETLEMFSTGDLEDLGWQLARFEIRALRELGFLPSLDACVDCGAAWPGTRAAFFSAAAGGLVCRDCRERKAGSHRDVEALTARAVGALRELADPRTRAVEDSSAATLRAVHETLARSCSALLERPLRMVEYSTRLLAARSA